MDWPVKAQCGETFQEYGIDPIIKNMYDENMSSTTEFTI